MDSTGTCTLPCGIYNWNRKWCVDFPNNEVTKNEWKEGRNLSGTSGATQSEQKIYWKECEYPDWDECMPVDRVPLIEWQDEDYEGKKIKRKNKNKKQKKY